MLSSRDDTPTIRNALVKRLMGQKGSEFRAETKGEPGIRVVEIKMKFHEPEGEAAFLRVGVMVMIDGTLLARSTFDLPEQFTHLHLMNELDQCCEQYKAARRDYWLTGRQYLSPDHSIPMSGTGLRGLWKKDVAPLGPMVGAGS